MHVDADEVELHAWDPSTGQPVRSEPLVSGESWTATIADPALPCEDRLVFAFVSRTGGVLTGHHTHWVDPGLLSALGVGFDEVSEELELRATSAIALDSVRFYVWTLDEGGSLGAVLLRSDDELHWSTALHHHQLGNDFDALALFPDEQRFLGVFVGLDAKGWVGHAIPLP